MLTTSGAEFGSFPWLSDASLLFLGLVLLSISIAILCWWLRQAIRVSQLRLDKHAVSLAMLRGEMNTLTSQQASHEQALNRLSAAAVRQQQDIALSLQIDQSTVQVLEIALSNQLGQANAVALLVKHGLRSASVNSSPSSAESSTQQASLASSPICMTAQEAEQAARLMEHGYSPTATSRSSEPQPPHG